MLDGGCMVSGKGSGGSFDDMVVTVCAWMSPSMIFIETGSIGTLPEQYTKPWATMAWE